MTATISMPLIYLATSSDVKFNQYLHIAESLGVSLRRVPTVTSTREPQLEEGVAPEELVSHPLRQAARFVELRNIVPYVIEDTVLVVNGLSSSRCKGSVLGLPGSDTKGWWRNLGADGLLRLLRDSRDRDRSAVFICQMGCYLGRGNYGYVRHALDGKISKTTRISNVAKRDVPMSNPFFFHSIFVPANLKMTLAEMDGITFSLIDYRRACFVKLAELIRGADIKESPQSPQLAFNF